MISGVDETILIYETDEMDEMESWGVGGEEGGSQDE